MIRNNFHRKMQEKIQQYSNQQYLDGYVKREFLTNDGDADIFFHIDNRNDLIDSRSYGEQLSLDWGVYDFLEEKTSMLGSDIPIHFHIKGIALPSKEQEAIRHIFKEHYAIELFKVQKKYVQCRNKIIKLVCSGTFFLLAYALLYLFTDFDFFMTVFGFLFSFSLWEAFDAYIYTFNDIKIEREAVTQNLLTNIVFEEEKNVEEEKEEPEEDMVEDPSNGFYQEDENENPPEESDGFDTNHVQEDILDIDEELI